MHSSIPLPQIEIIQMESTEFSPLISKCQIKVCYVGDSPNRNGSIITKEVAKEMAPSLRGAAIVGHFDEEIHDFGGHDTIVECVGEEWRIKDGTKPYGFVDLNAPVWFQKFNDEGTEHEYLMTEGWLWTEQYPECRRIIERGNNQSMELSEKNLNGHWAEMDNSGYEFFIINSAIISKLCILGEDVEPCFEGSQITKSQFSLNQDFEQRLSEMMNEIKNILTKGGASEMDIVDATLPEETAPLEEEIEEVHEELPEEEEIPVEEIPSKEEIPEDNFVQYNLDEIPEYVELCNKFSALEATYEQIVAELNGANEELTGLRDFKASIEKKEKEALVDQFYMLSDEDKADVRNNIDTYSLEDIEAKLSVICVRNRVSFSLEEEASQEPTTYNLDPVMGEDAGVPAWVKAAMAVAKDMN